MVTDPDERKAASRKKVREEASGDSLEAFYDRLCDLGGENVAGIGERKADSKNQAEQAVALARKFGILKSQPLSFSEAISEIEDPLVGSEHIVEFSVTSDRVSKITVPPAYGFAPVINRVRNANLRDDPSIPAFRESIEFIGATPCEYLRRWIQSNEVFGDDVRLEAIVQWADGQVSFSISQPHYNGEPATHDQIEEYFLKASWTRLKDPAGQHLLFFNYAFNVLAIDAMPRNCYLNEDGLQPFDVILCEPDNALQDFLEIYP